MDFVLPDSLNTKVIQLDQSAHTAADAAAALNCDIAQIAKSLVFYDVVTKEPILIIASGANRVDKTKVGEYLHKKIKTASPEFVLEHTGYPVGSVPPFCHIKKLPTLIDESLMQFDVIYAAAGSETSIFSIPPQQLVSLTLGQVISINFIMSTDIDQQNPVTSINE
jgi:prolyl-tRNA editing enzyme YbaK/EbsC (Cys-tRNA(Pro) deacylase)